MMRFFLIIGSAAALNVAPLQLNQDVPQWTQPSGILLSGKMQAGADYEKHLITAIEDCPRFVEILHSQGNGAAYVGKIFVGGQKLDAIWDTGSDEEVLNSVHTLNMRSPCQDVQGNAVHDCYNKVHSKRYKALRSFPEKIAYGSGDTFVLPGTDTVSFVGDKCRSVGVKFMELISSDIPQLLSHDIDAVAGIGPMGFDRPQFLKQMGVSRFSFCFMGDTNKPGTVIWNDFKAQENPEGFQFTTMPNHGTDYWAVKVSDFTVAPKTGNHQKVGCVDETCYCVVDTGTSLITLDQNTLKHFETVLNHFEKTSGITCNDETLHKFPTLKFYLEGKEHEFKPADYLMYTNVDQIPSYVREMIHFTSNMFPSLAKDAGSKKECVMMFTPPMAKGMCILGMPFFRNYMVTFDRAERTISTARHDGECKPARAGFWNAMPQNHIKSIDASYLRVSSAYTRLTQMHKEGINVLDLFRTK